MSNKMPAFIILANSNYEMFTGHLYSSYIVYPRKGN